MQGYLSKWTNYAGGFKSRWFVLDESGMLAYYKNQDDASNACRGSINMKYAKIWIDASDKNRFDVIGKGTNRYHLRTEHPVEAKRWIFALSQSKQWIIDMERGLVSGKQRASIMLDDSHRPQFLVDEEGGSINDGRTGTPGGGRGRAGSKVSMTDSIVAARNNNNDLGGSPLQQQDRGSEDDEDDLFESQAEPPLGDEYRTKVNLVQKQVDLQQQLLESLLIITTGGESGGNGAGASHGVVAHASKQVMLVDAFRTSLKSLRGLVDEVLDMSEDREAFWKRKFEAEAERRRLWEESMHSLAFEQQEMERFVQVVVQERKARKKERKRKEAEAERGGEVAAGEEEAIEEEEAEMDGSGLVMQHGIEDKEVEVAVEGKGETKPMMTEEPTVIADTVVEERKTLDGKKTRVEERKKTLDDKKAGVEERKKTLDDKKAGVEERKKTLDDKKAGVEERKMTLDDKKVDEQELDDEMDDEEFFDAISDEDDEPVIPSASMLSSIAITSTHHLPPPETLVDSSSIGASSTGGTSIEDMSTTDSGAPSEIASLNTTASTQPASASASAPASASASVTGISSSQLVPDLKCSAVGYPTEMRTTLPIQDNEKPQVSLWSILKNSIGKDLTRISLPVYFNEPTSMLQRMCEDIEYSELLDIAAKQPGSTERMMYVVAFAVSNFSSVPGRVAKPFNPLLGETFEYVREDKGYRYISEQVSHHPPLSACHCESPNYKFYAESDIKNKFWGRSFELHPKGVSHVELKVPNSFTPLSDDPNGCTLEHYSYKKPIVAVTNLITGNPTFDMYGDMEFSNHRTRDTCVLTFKARGWRSKDANEFRGFVTSGETGEKVWEIAGRWNERMLARRVKPVGSGGSTSGVEEDLGSDNAAAAARPQQDSPQSGKGRNIILLWKRHPFPTTKVPFNLTEFAITLNHLPESLRPHIAPTDSRLRPDQRAMEIGEYDHASDEKTRVEEKQRAKRKARELREEQYGEWEPRWFRRAIEEDTQEGFWEFTDEYWSERERVRKEKEEAGEGVVVRWKVDDDDIF
ncbi:Oxysterol-binding protein-domain-containing protein [Jimgerdemannia flammicorona]|uniref:Oxysterol-binding protein-domain-containing protein n=1 Tax=Jimgerdemannia flammicorona TaxID=994334 RepID=A0A433AVS2_9FUNG|nr:Oxysterol-binding protein-domain-containing protein [Jimgerdemannia flammicorona]